MAAGPVDMIAQNWRGQSEALEAGLLVTAKKMANARGQMIAASHRNDGEGWRNAPFLWPLMDRS